VTREQFEQYWSGNSGISVDQMHLMGIRAEECQCGDDLCLGWAVWWDNWEASRG